MATLLFPILEKAVDDIWIRLEREQITPWAFLTAGPPFHVKDFYGKSISYQGIEFEGSPRHVYWARYLEPFLEDATEKIVKETLVLAKEKRQDARPSLNEVAGLLKALTRRAYNRMADIDRRLIGKGYPESVPLRNTEAEVAEMELFIDRRINAEIAMQRPQWKINQFYNEHPFLFWFITLIVGTIVTFAAT